jgi:hypothetical protein
MKRFEFRMEALLRVKSNLLDLEEYRLQGLLAEQRAARAEQRRVREEAARQANELCKQRSIPGNAIAWFARHQERARERVEELGRRVREMEGGITEQRRKVQRLQVDVRVLIRFKDRAYRQWCAELDKEIEMLGAESYLNRFVRERSESPAEVA